MARLLVKLHGEEISRITFENGIEYVAGRAPDAQIQLANERGISRHHLKFYEKDGVWICASLSKFVLIHKGGAPFEVVELGENCAFSVAPYDFYFESTATVDHAAAEVAAPHAGSSANLPATHEASDIDDSPLDRTTVRANNEATMAGVSSNLVPYFRISYPNTADDEVLKLEGHLWTAGRDLDCEIPIESAHISRKHFELARTNEGFFITDLGSSNGTKINGQRIAPHEPTRIESGDEIQVKNVEMGFEIRDLNFNQRLEKLPAAAPVPIPSASANSYLPAPWDQNAHGHEQLTQVASRPRDACPHNAADATPDGFAKLRQMGTKKLVVRGALVVLIPVILIVAMMPDKPKVPTERGPASGNTSVAFDKLTNEQRSVIKDSFNLARNLYVQGKYELCLTELAKLVELIPQYENSKELQSFCEQGRELVHRQRDLERKERERAQIEQQIAGLVEICKTKLKDGGSVEETRQCLSEAMELDPEHHLIVEMIHSAQMMEEERKLLDSQRQVQNAKVKKGLAQFNRARSLYKDGKLALAAGEYEKYISTPYPQSDTSKNAAKRDLASIKKEIKTKVERLAAECKSLGDQGHLKDAFAACEKAFAEDPQNESARDTKNQIVSKLKREMKSIYEDSVLEESLGNVDTAKEKWKKIVHDDLKNGDYANKARSKLQKYGDGN